MANAGCGSPATILFLFLFQAALQKGKTFPLTAPHFPVTLPRVPTRECDFTRVWAASRSVRMRGGGVGVVVAAARARKARKKLRTKL